MQAAEIHLTEDPWVVSDTHFLHTNIARYCNRPVTWQEDLIAHWRSTVSPNETVLHLGDLALGNFILAKDIVLALPGKIILVKGNHDHFSEAQYGRMGIWKLITAEVTELFWPGAADSVFVSHAPQFGGLPGKVNLHGHMHNNPYESFEGELNVSLEVVGYRLWRLSEILEEARHGWPPKAE